MTDKLYVSQSCFSDQTFLPFNLSKKKDNDDLMDLSLGLKYCGGSLVRKLYDLTIICKVMVAKT